MQRFDHSLNQSGATPKILIVCAPHLRDMYNELGKLELNAEISFCSDDKEEIKKMIPNKNALIACPRHLFTNELMELARPNLKWVHNPGAGVEHFMFPEFVNSNIVFTNGKIIQGPECADHAMALLLALTRGLHFVLRNEQATNNTRPIELFGKTAVVIGVGGIGMLIAERASAFGMKVIGVDADLIPMLKMFKSTHTFDELPKILPEADIVFCSAPLTGDSENMISNTEFNSMVKRPIFINISRGGVIDTDALVAALAEGKLSSCGLDVTNPEPLPIDHPLRQMKNVIITPHIAGLSDFNRQRSLELIKKNIIRFTQNKPLLNIVNKKLGF